MSQQFEDFLIDLANCAAFVAWSSLMLFLICVFG
jgi:hypothetical protein